MASFESPFEKFGLPNVSLPRLMTLLKKCQVLKTLHLSQYSLYFFFQIFQVLEFPSERERMTTVQNLTIIQRENLLKMIFNLTYGLDDDEMEALKGPSINYHDDRIEIRV